MKKYLGIFSVVWTVGISAALAQGAQSDLDLFKKIDAMSAPEKTPDKSSKTSVPTQKEPTVITATKEASFDGKTRMAVFMGEVFIKDPQFTLNADKLTVYFKKQGEDAKPGEKPKPVISSPKPDTVKPGSQGSGGLEKAIAEGNVVVVSDRPDANGGAPVHYVGKGAKVEYNAINGEAILSGWPQVQQGINTIVSTEESTVIHLFRDGRMKIDGAHKVNISDPGPGKNMEAK